MKPRLFIIGTGGHAAVVIDAVHKQGKYQIAGLVDDFRKAGTIAHGYTVDYSINELADNAAKGVADDVHFFIAVGDNYSRKQIRRRLPDELRYATIIHPSATVSDSANISAGSLIMANAVINSGAAIYEYCIINTGAIVEHDSIINPFSSLAPSATIGGRCIIGKDSAIGIGATVSNGVYIGQRSVIGAGSVVLKAVPDDVVAFGSPCKVIHPRLESDKYM